MLNFVPDAPLAGQIRVLKNAIAVPWGRGEKRGIARPCGIFTQDGEYCEDAVLYRQSARPASVRPEFPKADEISDILHGTYLFGGMAYGHFGHALCESTARLWGVDHVKEHIDHVLFFPKPRKSWPNRTLGQVKTITATMGDIPPCIAINEPTQIERLIIAPQGFGVAEMVAGSPEFRAFTHKRLRQNGEKNGPEKIYISRTQVFSKRGRLLLEEHIEDHMRAEGYEIFHPQHHPLKTQLEYYRAAKFIVSSDNSALHLAAFVADPACKVAILVRRPSGIYRDFQRQLRNFAQIDPLIINAGERYWFRADEAIKKNEIISLIDFEKTAKMLAEENFTTNAVLPPPNEEDIQTALAQVEDRAKHPYKEVFI